MYLLAIDTSGKMASVGIAKDRTMLCSKSVDSRLSQSIVVFDLLKEMSREIQLPLEQIEVVIVTIGPGSFTGLRVGIMTAKTISHLLKIPICGISTLEALSYPFKQDNALVVNLLDGSRGDVYAAAYWNHADIRVPVLEAGLFKADHFLESLKDVLTRHPDYSRVILSGSGWVKHPSLVTSLQTYCSHRFPLTEPDSTSFEIIPENMVSLVLDKYQASSSWGEDALKLEPSYLRKPEAEIVYENRLLQPKPEHSP